MNTDPPTIRQNGPDVLLTARVQPRAPRNQVVVGVSRALDQAPDRITLRVTAPPVEGAANAACLSLLADALGIAPSRILILRGTTARQKVFRIRDADAATIFDRLQSAR